MNRGVNCGTIIYDNQAQKYNNLCSNCIRTKQLIRAERSSVKKKVGKKGYLQKKWDGKSRGERILIILWMIVWGICGILVVIEGLVQISSEEGFRSIIIGIILGIVALLGLWIPEWGG